MVETGRRATAFEVKSGRTAVSAGMESFRRDHASIRAQVIGTGGIPLDQFFSQPPDAREAAP